MTSKIHKIRFYNPQPQSINCVAYNRTNKVIAVGRKEASIEIWDISHSPLLLTHIPGVLNGSVEALGWASDRLFSTGLGGSLVEWDLITLTMKKSVVLTGYAAWCLDVDPHNKTIAVGTEQGYINIYSLENNDIVYKSLFDKQEGRILCCKFDKTGNILVTGSIDTIRVWNVQTGHAVTRISASRRGKEVIVWCLAVLSDNTIVSGDSHGRLTFWDSTVGDQIESFTTHKADILALTVSDNEKSIYCSGVDPVIVNFIKVEMTQSNRVGSHWVKNIQRHVHEHDVRALVLQGDKLLSAGADGYLAFSSYPPKWVMRVPPMLPEPRSCIATKNRLLLLRYIHHLEIWKLGSYALKSNGKLIIEDNIKNSNVAADSKIEKSLEQDTPTALNHKVNKGQALKLSANPIKLATIHVKGKNQLKCCQISSNGQYVIYSTDSHIRMLKLEMDEEDDRNVSISKVLIDTLAVSTCEKAMFTDDSNNVIISSSGTLYVLQIDPQSGASLQQSIPTDKYLKSPSILHIAVSAVTPSGTTYLVAADISGAAAVWSRSTKRKFEPYITLPKYHNAPSAVLMNHQDETLIMTFVDQKLIEYNLVAKKFSEWPNKSLPKGWRTRKTAVNSIHIHPQKPGVLMFQDHLSLSILEKINVTDKEALEPPAKKGANNNNTAYNLRVIPVKYLSGFYWLSNDEAVMLETLPEHIIPQLPPAFATKKYAS